MFSTKVKNYRLRWILAWPPHTCLISISFRFWITFSSFRNFSSSLPFRYPTRCSSLYWTELPLYALFDRFMSPRHLKFSVNTFAETDVDLHAHSIQQQQKRWQSQRAPNDNKWNSISPSVFIIPCVSRRAPLFIWRKCRYVYVCNTNNVGCYLPYLHCHQNHWYALCRHSFICIYICNPCGS